MKIILLLSLFAVVLCVPTKEHRRGPKDKDLSNETHYPEDTEDHNKQYDHEAFLGKEQADEFDHLKPEESRRRLKIIFGKIDKDNNKKITHDELKNWVIHVANRYVYESAEQQLPQHDEDKDGQVTLKEYHDTSFGEIEDENAEYDPHRKLSYKEMRARDARRFQAADSNKDGKLDKREFASFLHPEDYEHMREIIIDEALQDMDKDRDGYVTEQEYIDDIWPQWERGENEKEPDWVQSEREQFFQHRDKDNDKKLSRRELADWIAPEGHDNAEAEARHLIFNADKDKDKELTMEEMLSNEDLFVGSQVTNYGDYLNRHDEF